ncbi:ABC transporter ATP-binding protein [Cellulomonas fimi]|uniref:ABC transporter related protein n=1 Tax=Cellulomonas fimi (strain ATCC 484 / DSM 20113 / JCM 1341 / CCUG 24087 / LMG 16345 / NBRC 15513 / NCIMB 8980 / NCTC 7547 / NRS-133) TaxID=590998 RepID=F4H3G5_CELFA|nr:ABC transporter ATP-binding protein [Cellulomonas fimi]AEE46510.1 ABC transporter related protein [Cellulomonas fimi ATCC 484]NNH08865.1 ABC transporter ATP-binding protein [Cellulomonas fimi]VEH33283.1 Putative HMP/thiamine import ATP-binding protein YkoD [Cellulomonas fimi]
MITVRGLTVRYPDATGPVLDGLDLDVAAGEDVLLLGGSGGGKSTLLRVLAGVVPRVLDADVDGSAHVAGEDVLATSPAARVGYLTQSPADQLCLPTVHDEVAFGLENRGVPADRITARVDAALTLVGAAHLAGRRTAELSGGEGQRVALAATLVTQPDVLLLDEPTALLDPAAARGAWAALTAASSGRASVLVEHRLDELPRLPARTVVLDDGGVAADGPTARVLHDLAPRLAARGLALPVDAELRGAGVRATTDLAVLPGTSACGGAARVLRARGMHVRRSGRDVLRRVDLDVRAGHVTAVVGPNGSGKSTLLLALAGLLVGDVDGAVDGGSVGLVFQHPEHQLLARTVRDEIAWGPRRARRPDVGPVVDAALDRFALSGLAGQDPFRLSGGEQRRLSVAAAAVCGHDVLLADEPTFGQDRRTAVACGDALRALADEGRGVVVVTHDLRLVAEVADDVVVLREGRVLRAGPAEQVLRDGSLLAAAGLVLPPVVRAACADGRPLRAVLAALRRAVADRSGDGGALLGRALVGGGRA